MKGLSRPRPIVPPRPVPDLMTALKGSLAQETGGAAKPRRKAAGDRRQTGLRLPVSGKKEDEPPARQLAHRHGCQWEILRVNPGVKKCAARLDGQLSN